MRIELSCRECGSNRFALDKAMTDVCIVTCQDCGHRIGTLGKIKQDIARQVIAKAKTRSSYSASGSRRRASA
jgi:hypothetical protein